MKLTLLLASLAISCCLLIAMLGRSKASALSNRAALRTKQPIQQSATQASGQRPVNTDLISFTVEVLDSKGRFVPGLPKEAFTLLDNNLPQPIKFFSNEDTPVSVGIIFDTSASMSAKELDRARQAVARLIQSSDKRDEFFLMDFNSTARVLVDNTSNADDVIRALSDVRGGGQMAVYDAVYLATEKIQHGRYERRALLLITDRAENDSKYKPKEVQRALQESGASLYAIGIMEGVMLPSRAGFAIQVRLGDLANPTGGETFFPQSSAELDKAFDNIAQELQHQYSIGYKPESLITDAKPHRIKVKVDSKLAGKGVSVRTRSGYLPLLKQHP